MHLHQDPTTYALDIPLEGASPAPHPSTELYVVQVPTAPDSTVFATFPPHESPPKTEETPTIRQRRMSSIHFEQMLKLIGNIFRWRDTASRFAALQNRVSYPHILSPVWKHGRRRCDPNVNASS